jgi:tryptophanyl-tRNA synthetase
VLFERIDREVAPMRARYEELINAPARIDEILCDGARKARQIASPFMASLRHAVGLRGLVSTGTLARPTKVVKAALPSFKQYRERDGKFHFKLVDPHGRVLLQSLGFDSPREAGQAVAALQQQGSSALPALKPQLAALADVPASDISAALQQLIAAQD